MTLLHQILNIINIGLARIPWQAILASGVLSPVAAILNKWWNVQKDIVKFLVVFIVASITAGINYLAHVATKDPSIILVQGALLTFLAQPFYFLVVKPGRAKLIAYVENRIAKGIQLQTEIKSAAIPASGLASPEQASVDFSH